MSWNDWHLASEVGDQEIELEDVDECCVSGALEQRLCCFGDDDCDICSWDCDLYIKSKSKQQREVVDIIVLD